jgi:hypothetical protein
MDEDSRLRRRDEHLSITPQLHQAYRKDPDVEDARFAIGAVVFGALAIMAALAVTGHL